MPRNKGHRVSRCVELRTAGFGAIGRSSSENGEGGLIFLPRDSCGFIMGDGHLGGVERRWCGEAAGEEMSRAGSSIYKMSSLTEKDWTGGSRAIGGRTRELQVHQCLGGPNTSVTR